MKPDCWNGREAFWLKPWLQISSAGSSLERKVQAKLSRAALDHYRQLPEGRGVVCDSSSCKGHAFV